MEEKLLIGAHTSASGGVSNALYHGQEIGATTIQLFTSNQRRWQAGIIDEKEITLWEKALEETGLEKIMSHSSYLINLGSAKEELLDQSRQAFSEEIDRCKKLGIAYLNFHPGSATTNTEETCLDIIVESILSFAPLLEKGKTRLLVEATAGQGTNLGYKFEHLTYIVERCKEFVPIGVCIDTCHIFAAGYDIRDDQSFEKTFDAFDKIVGMQHLYALHINDSKQELNSRKDRHESLGEGKIGMRCFELLMQDPRTQNLPKYLETPLSNHWREEIQLLRNLATKKYAHKN